MGDKKKGFFSRLVEGELIPYSAVFPRSMMISMRRSKRRLSWAI